MGEAKVTFALSVRIRNRNLLTLPMRHVATVRLLIMSHIRSAPSAIFCLQSLLTLAVYLFYQSLSTVNLCSVCSSYFIHTNSWKHRTLLHIKCAKQGIVLFLSIIFCMGFFFYIHFHIQHKMSVLFNVGSPACCSKLLASPHPSHNILTLQLTTTH